MDRWDKVTDRGRYSPDIGYKKFTNGKECNYQRL